MSKMVERVATALTLTANASGSTGDDLIRDMARQAIMAMREPTEKMIEAGLEEDSLSFSPEPGEGRDYIPTEDIWQAMIDAALRDA